MNGGAHAIALLVPDLQQLPQLKQAVARQLPPGAGSRCMTGSG